MLTLTPLELLEIFPEALPIVKRNLALYRKAKRESEPIYGELLSELMKLVYINGNETERGIDFMTRHFYDRPLLVLDRHISRLKHLESLYEQVGKPKREGEITETDIANAKQVPLSQYLEITRSGFALCLFHDDTWPSAKYYEKQNKVHCFVCSKSFDVIDVVSKLQGIEFLDAVKFILHK